MASFHYIGIEFYLKATVIVVFYIEKSAKRQVKICSCKQAGKARRDGLALAILGEVSSFALLPVPKNKNTTRTSVRMAF